MSTIVDRCPHQPSMPCARQLSDLFNRQPERKHSMKIAVTSARVLLGFLFHIFGLNGFLHFIPMKPPAGLAGQYLAL